MKWSFSAGLMSCIASFCLLYAPVVLAAESPMLHLDGSFVGRSMQMEVIEKQLMVRWDADGIPPSTVQASVDASGTAMVRIDAVDGATSGSFSYDVGLPAKIATSSWDDIQLEIRSVSGTWDVVPSTMKAGWQFASVSSSSVEIRQRVVPHGLRVGMASWYRYKSCRCAASPDFPKGTALLVERADDPTRFTVVKVNDFGPERAFFPERAIDLDYEAFKEIGNPRGGTLAVRVEPLSPSDPRSRLAGEKLGVKKVVAKKIVKK